MDGWMVGWMDGWRLFKEKQMTFFSNISSLSSSSASSFAFFSVVVIANVPSRAIGGIGGNDFDGKSSTPKTTFL